VRSLFRKFREPIFVVALLGLPFGIFLAKAKNGHGLNLLDRALIFITAPAERSIVVTAFGAIDGWNGYLALHGVREDNLRLRREVLRAQAVDQQAAELKAENERLKHLLDYSDKQAPVRMLVAQVVAVGASPHSHTLRIARGTDDGVARGMPVVSPDGVVGTVAQTTGSYADVQLITSPTSAVPAISARTRARSTVKGTGDVRKCRLAYALRTDDLLEGDLLVTAPVTGFFPKGLRIGKVIDVDKKPQGMFNGADVAPAVDFARLDEVMVVLDQPAVSNAPEPVIVPAPAQAGEAPAPAAPQVDKATTARVAP
jgi:rod shape-determining protein MreC